MTERLAQSVTVKHLARRAIDVRGGTSGGHRIERRLLRLGHLLQQPPLTRSGATHHYRPCHVHGIAVQHAAKIQNNQVASRQLAVARPVMGQGRVRPGGDDGIKRRLVKPYPSELGIDAGRHLTLALSR